MSQPHSQPAQKAGLRQDRRGIALLLVMAVVFLVIASITVAAGFAIANLDTLRSRFDVAQAEAAFKAAQERIRGLVKINNDVFNGCQVGDCFSVESGSCVACSSASDNTIGEASYRATLRELVAPAASLAGYAALGFDAYSKNRHFRQSDHFCLNYCAASGFECGDNGCGGSCGSCAGGETCGGGGVPGVCDTGNCSDINIECGAACTDGSICGGGTIVDATNRIIAVQSGCNEAGTDCDGTTDTVSRAWDSGAIVNTSAEDENDGRVNVAILDPAVNPQYAAAAYCDTLSYQGHQWYLPAKNELDKIYAQVVAGNVSQVAGGAYSSSTDEAGADNLAWIQNLGNGAASADKKATAYFIRCVRRY